MKHYVAFPEEGGQVELHRLKEWLRRNPEHLPPTADPDTQTTQQLRRHLLRHGWTMQDGESDVRLTPPIAGGPQLAANGVRESKGRRAAKPLSGEKLWVSGLVARLQNALQAEDDRLQVRDQYRLAYSREILQYRESEPAEETGMKYETDLLIVERVGSGWTPRVVVEAKLRSVTTHDAITYSQKASTHKHVHPYLRYGIILGARGNKPLPGRLFRHGAHFDFMLAWRGLEPAPEELTSFAALLVDEVRASRLLQEIMFNTRARGRTGYSLLHKPVIAR